MDYSKFYTPQKTAKTLIYELSIPEPQKVIDICCGSCNLLFAAKKKWNNVNLYGVDISESQSTNEVIYERKDGRQFAIEHPHEFPLVLANPPFDFIKIKKQFPKLFVNEFKDITTSRLEIEMLIANLSLLSQNGVLLIILPSSFVEAETYKKIRQIIANNYYVESIIKLNETTFGASRINCYALIIHNTLKTQYHTKIGCISEDLISYTSNINSETLKKGYWTCDNTTFVTNSLNIKRGNISSACFTSNGQPILHTAKTTNCNWSPQIKYISKDIVPTVFAESGDIIVSRIGKSAGQWCLYKGEKIAISDCLYRIKDLDTSLIKKMEGKKFDRNLKGVATRYITITDFNCWINSL
ncbi:MAG: SAM-dependent DNA methyltransferase [Oscillospiraceae bacterium]|nr:SAM-dependent DNA methyltransferase [Candidatus Limimonas egerieequi]